MLNSLLKPIYRSIGSRIPSETKTRVASLEDACTIEITTIRFAGNPWFRAVLDSVENFVELDFAKSCLAIRDVNHPLGQAYYTEEAARTDDHLISLSVRRTLIPPGGKGHPEVLTLHYDPAQDRLIPFPELFRLAPDRLYPLLRRLVLEKIEQDGLLEDAERVLFDDAKQQNEEVLSAGLVTAEGLVFSFGPAQCHQLYWATPIEVTLPWDTRL